MKRKRPGLPRFNERPALLSARRNIKMARSVHAYVRGSTSKFYEWLKASDNESLPRGPAVWICGDCHVGNLGPIANAKGRIDIQIRDLDQTVIGNPAHDLVRLGLSLATAARGSDLPGVTTARMVEQMIIGYQDALSGKPKAEIRQSEPIQKLLKKAIRRRWKHLAEERIDDVRPQIPLGKRFWALSKAEKLQIRELFKAEAVRKMVTSLRGRKDSSKIEVLDAAYWMKGCSSLGRLRYAVLLRVGRVRDKDTGYCLIDIKESGPAAAPRLNGSKVFKDHALRVVEGAIHLSPFLGERMLGTRLLGRSVVIRELLPQDLKLEMESMTVDEAITAARHLA